MANNGKTSQAAFGAQARGTSAGQRARNVEVAWTSRADVDGGGGGAAGSPAASSSSSPSSSAVGRGGSALSAVEP